MFSSPGHLLPPWSCHLCGSPGWRRARPGPEPRIHSECTSLAALIPSGGPRAQGHCTLYSEPLGDCDSCRAEARSRASGCLEGPGTSLGGALGHVPPALGMRGKLGSPGGLFSTSRTWSPRQPLKPAAAFGGGAQSPLTIAWELPGVCSSIRGRHSSLLGLGVETTDCGHRTQDTEANRCLRGDACPPHPGPPASFLLPSGSSFLPPLTPPFPPLPCPSSHPLRPVLDPEFLLAEQQPQAAWLSPTVYG